MGSKLLFGLVGVMLVALVSGGYYLYTVPEGGGSGSTTTPPVRSGEAVVYGLVTDAITGEPAVNVTVSVYAYSNETPPLAPPIDKTRRLATTNTDDNGYYNITLSISEPTLVVVVVWPDWKSVELKPGETVRVDLSYVRPMPSK